MRLSRLWTVGVLACATAGATGSAAEPPPAYEQAATIFKKYCAGCHNADDLDGGFSVESYAGLLNGGENGPALVAGDAKISRLVRMLTGEAKPKMPPKDQPAPTPAEFAILKAWIDGGAKGPDGAEPDRSVLNVPRIPAAQRPTPVTALAYHPDGKLLAVARDHTIDLVTADKLTPDRRIGEFKGKVTALEFSRDGGRLVAATGVPGLVGEAFVWQLESQDPPRKFAGHRDLLFAACLSPDGSLLATAGYDRQIIVWNATTGEQQRVLKGHNDAIYDLAFHPSGTILASASGDQTVKLWQVATGLRLDTLSQPLKEQYTVAFSPDGEFVLAGGGDNRIRVWRLLSRDKAIINPLVYARFAHEGAVVGLGFSNDGKTLVSVGDDREIKLWNAADYTQTRVYDKQPDVVAALAVAPQPGATFLVGRMDGTLQAYPLAAAPPSDQPAIEPVTVIYPAAAEAHAVADQEPNDLPEQATPAVLPATLTGVIQASRPEQRSDVDLYRFTAKRGEQWIFEVNAARSMAPLDSKIEILDAAGQPVPRLLLRAVRDSYITFRPIDSTSRDCRLHNWEEMKLNEYLYLQGEVVKLFLAPRGPDSGFGFYPYDGPRRCYFDTSPTTHALHEPCYIVEPHPPGTPLIPNGLPTFPLFFENDDDGLRQFGADSRLTFTAPADGTFLFKVTDVRGFQGENYKYTVTARPAKPDFTVTLDGLNPVVNAGSGKEFAIKVQRLDDFQGEIQIDVTGLPPGYFANTPIIVQAGQEIARGTVYTLPNTPAPTPENAKTSRVTAKAVVNGQEVVKEVGTLGEIKLADKPKILVRLERPELPAGVASAPPSADLATPPARQTFDVAPGETIQVKVRVERNGFDGRIQFEALNQNLPHGVIIDNIGLNGLMIVEGQTERTFFITAADWVPATMRTFHLKTNDDGGQTSWPITVRVVKP